MEEHNPREEAEWFQRLPVEAQEDLRRRWLANEGRAEEQRERRSRTDWRYIGESLLLFAVGDLLYRSLSFPSCLAIVLPGLALGKIAAMLRAGTFRYALLAFSVHLAYYGLWAFQPFHLVFATCIGAALGRIHELQRVDGSEF